VSAAPNERSALEVRGELERERQQLASSLERLRGELSRATDVTTKLRAHMPVALGAAFAGGFVVAGGVGATLRLAFRRDR
jgi:hypothetical protein